jgi:hypothetical protein
LFGFWCRERTLGVSITDILLIVLIADASQNGMADEYRSVSEGLVLVATLENDPARWRSSSALRLGGLFIVSWPAVPLRDGFRTIMLSVELLQESIQPAQVIVDTPHAPRPQTQRPARRQ